MIEVITFDEPTTEEVTCGEDYHITFESGMSSQCGKYKNIMENNSDHAN